MNTGLRGREGYFPEQHVEASVIVPVYNCEAYVETLLDSVLGQAGVSFEVIVVCDGATDGSLRVIEAVAARDARIRVIDQANRGVSATRNVGLELARGEWIVFADGDDWLRPGALQAWIDHGRRHELEIVLGNGFQFDAAQDAAGARPLLSRQPWGEICDGKTWIAHTVQQDEWAVYVWLQCIRRDFIERHGLRFEEGVVHEDMIWTLHVALRAARVGFVREPFYGYRRNPESITNSPSEIAVARRAAGYLRVLETLRTAAAQAGADRAFQRVLLRQLNRDGGNLLHLLRKRLHNPRQRQSYSRQFLDGGYLRAMLNGATNASEWWRVVRCWLVMLRYARTPVGSGRLLTRLRTLAGLVD